MDAKKNVITYEELRKMLIACADRIIRCEAYLTQIDSRIGDGDHGIGMRTGMTAAKRVLAADRDDRDIYAMMAEMSGEMERTMGGASGMIFSSLFSGNAKGHAPASEMTATEFAAYMESGLHNVISIGHAELGDKTMVDAFAPAVDAMKHHTGSFGEMILAAEKAAHEGMEKTKDQIAKFGRAKSLMERTLGFQDSGATSVWLIFLQMADEIMGRTTPDPAVEAEANEQKFVSKKIINDPNAVVAEEAEGFLAAFGKEIAAVPGVNGFVRKDIPDGKTALLIGGGSGHEPMFGFFLGDHLADAAANGNVFASPSPETVYQTAKAAAKGGGMIFLYGNYAGDNLNFDKAAAMLEEEGIHVRTVRIKDDVASAPRERMDDRRGIAGDVFAIKIAGAACAENDLEEAYRIACKARDNLYTIGVGLQGATIPGKTEPIFTLPAEEMEYGLGIHGEPGVRRTKMDTADHIVEELLDGILADSGIKEGDVVCTYINGLGSTTMMELMIMNRRLAQLLKEKKIRVHDMDVGSYVTTMEMAGASITLMKMDEELIRYYDMPCRSPYYNKNV